MDAPRRAGIMKMDAETIWNLELDPVYKESDTSWRHGEYRTEVYYEENTRTYWMTTYQLSNDGETNDLREGSAVFDQCWPVETKTIEFTLCDPNSKQE